MYYHFTRESHLSRLQIIPCHRNLGLVVKSKLVILATNHQKEIITRSWYGRHGNFLNVG